MDKNKRVAFFTLGIISVVAASLYIINLLRHPSKIQINYPPSISSTSDPLKKATEENIQKTFEYTKKEKNFDNGSEPVKTIDMKGSGNGEYPNLDSASSSLKFRLGSSIYKYLYQKDYQLFYCVKDIDKKEYGIELNAGVPDRDYENKIKELMKAWEGSLLKDMHALLFPDVIFSQAYLDTPLVFKDGASRYAEVSLPDGSKSSINYKVVSQSIYISTSLECLNKGADALFAP